jgi:hypothetical protein
VQQGDSPAPLYVTTDVGDVTEQGTSVDAITRAGGLWFRGATQIPGEGHPSETRSGSVYKATVTPRQVEKWRGGGTVASWQHASSF